MDASITRVLASARATSPRDRFASAHELVDARAAVCRAGSVVLRRTGEAMIDAHPRRPAP